MRLRTKCCFLLHSCRNITAEAAIPGAGANGVFLQILAIGGGIQTSTGRLIAQGYGEKCYGSSAAARAGVCNRTAKPPSIDPADDPFSESPVTLAVGETVILLTLPLHVY